MNPPLWHGPSILPLIPMTAACAVALGCVMLLYVGKRCSGNNKRASLSPPGPPGLPWIGTVTGIDPRAPWVTYRDWATRYGDLVYSRMLGKDIIIINSEKIAKELLNDRSWNNSDRPYFITNDLCGLEFNSAVLPYGDRWRLHRRFFHQTFRADALRRFLPFQHRQACQLLRQLLITPDRLDECVFEFTASIILNAAYDYDSLSHGGELIKIAAEVQEIAISVIHPENAMIVSAFPMLLNLPAWFPGMSFKTKMAHARKLTRYYVETAFEYSLQKLQISNAAPAMVHNRVRKMEENGIAPDESWMKELKGAAATAFLAGSETSHALLMTFFLMMMLNPEVQRKAQSQIDDVVGKDRLPTLEDRPSLPFIDAILWETHRYSPVLPLSVPHTAVDDDVYNGYHIPKGAFLITNLWSMAHDEVRFPHPHTFMPERFLNDDGSLKPNDIEHIAFGFGRRICVGRHFSDASVWAVMAKVLAVFKILKPLDENGLDISVEPKFSSGISIRPLPFQCRILPRTPGMDAKKLEGLIAASNP